MKEVMAEGGPGPVLRVLDQTSLYWVPVDVAEGCYGGFVVGDVAIMVAGEPEWGLWELFGDRDFQGLDGFAKGTFWFGD